MKDEITTQMVIKASRALHGLMTRIHNGEYWGNGDIGKTADIKLQEETRKILEAAIQRK